MQNKLISPYIDKLWERALPEGGFAAKPKGNYRPDATAWAILALSGAGTNDHLEPSRARLKTSQLGDGRVCALPELPDAYWPTPLAILASFNSEKQLVRCVPTLRWLKKFLHTKGCVFNRFQQF